jgi:L-iditol 2-dehydrogenase
MKAAVYYSQKDIRIEELPKPTIGEDEVLVEMKACGICGSDLMHWYLKDRAPLVLGHEPTGIIAAKGKNVKDFDVGDRVFVHHHVACLECHYCIRGDYTLCKRFHETNIKPGGFAQYFRVPRANLEIDTLKLPPIVSLEEGTLIEPVGCCLRALKKCNLKRGDSVAVIGAGSTGLIHLMLSKILGAKKTIVSDFIDFRLDTARRFGADLVINPKREDFLTAVMTETEGMGVDLSVVTAPNTKAYEAGIKVCRKGGKLCVFAPTVPGEQIQVSPKELFFNETQIIPSYSTSHVETKEALSLIASGKLRAKELITHHFRLDDISEAFKVALDSEKSLKVVVFN